MSNRHRPRNTRARSVVRLAVATLLLSLVTTSGATAQIASADLTPGDDLYEIRLVDGSVLFGRITAVDGNAITLTTSGGARLEVDVAQIESMELANGREVAGRFWREDPNTSRLFFTATGRALEQGEGYVGTYLVVLPFVAVGVTDRLTLAGGAPVLLGEFEPFYLAPKLELIRTRRARVSVGALHFIFQDENVGVAYGVGTFGDSDNALSAGLGFGYLGSDFSSEPVGMIGGELRSSARIKLITENYFLPDNTGVVYSGGLRYLGERFSADVAIAGAAGDDGGCCVPLLNFSYAFGGRR